MRFENRDSVCLIDRRREHILQLPSLLSLPLCQRGIQENSENWQAWVPACAGMTVVFGIRDYGCLLRVIDNVD